jgi:hypothetical protein
VRIGRRRASQPDDGRPWMGPLPAASGCDCRICRPDESYDDADRRTIDTVLEHGWQVMLVSEDAPCSAPGHHDHDRGEHGKPAPAFAYTVGLGHRCGHPELLMSGLDQKVMHRALNDVASRVMDGRRLAPGDVLEGVLANAPVVVERLSPVVLDETVTWSGWLHRSRPEALVLVWPSTAGVFAWQPGAPDVLDELQPTHWREPIRHTGGVAPDPPWSFPVGPDQVAFTCRHVVDDGQVVLWAARESDDERGEDWSFHCGASGHDTEDMRLVHLAHLVRGAPSLRELAGLAVGHEANRRDADARWEISQLA